MGPHDLHGMTNPLDPFAGFGVAGDPMESVLSLQTLDATAEAITADNADSNACTTNGCNAGTTYHCTTNSCSGVRTNTCTYNP